MAQEARRGGPGGSYVGELLSKREKWLRDQVRKLSTKDSINFDDDDDDDDQWETTIGKTLDENVERILRERHEEMLPKRAHHKNWVTRIMIAIARDLRSLVKDIFK